jgi:PKHD-type hydroxylase
MLLTIALLTDPAERAALTERIAALPWADGRATAGKTASRVKDNEQAVLDDLPGSKLRTELHSRIQSNPVVKAAARPRRFSALMISRTSPGGRYGAHVDNAFMGKGLKRLRTDLAFTLFLNEPHEYDGGELAIHAAGVTSSMKRRAGELVLYPATSIHEVKPVTRGQRIVAIGWIESAIADAAQRELLFDLTNLRATLAQKSAQPSAELLTLDKSIANLLRMWGEV